MCLHLLRTRLAAGLGVATAVLAVAAPAGASARDTARDTTAPTLRLEPYSRYVVGDTADITYDGDFAVWFLRFALRWTASDPGGICGQTLTEQSYDTLGGDTDPVLGGDTTTTTRSAGARAYAFTENALNNERVQHRFVVRATDCAGNTAVSRIAETTVDIREDTAPEIRYTGAWRTARFGGFSGGTAHFATAAGARATTTVDGGPVALVMEQAANRGSADVYVDGVREATVGTYSATTRHRRVVWQALLPAGTHTVDVVNRATAGHPRIDLDVVLH
ncbi:MAG TPA: hypothetical protein VGD72_15185 [Mycobacteriales bacterium]|jgi:hypothetical protein